MTQEDHNAVPDSVLTKEFLSQFKTEDDVSKFLTKLHAQVLEKMLEGEMDVHLGYEKNSVIDNTSTFETEMLGEIKAGFPSPAENIREKLDLIKLLVRHKASTFFFRVSGISMVDAAMDEGDIIIVDRAIDPYNNCKAVCYIDGEYTVKRVEISDKGVRLMPANENNTAYKPIDVTPENNFVIWGVVTWVIKKM